MGAHASGGGPPRSALFGHGSWSEALRISDVLRRETVGGALLLAATVLAMVWANSPWASAYEAVRDTRLGPASLHLDLTVGQWAADGLLAIFPTGPTGKAEACDRAVDAAQLALANVDAANRSRLPGGCGSSWARRPAGTPIPARAWSW